MCDTTLTVRGNPRGRPQFLTDIWRCNDDIIRFVIKKFASDLYWPDYHFRTAIFRILAEDKLYLLVEMKDFISFDGILYQLGLRGQERLRIYGISYVQVALKSGC